MAALTLLGACATAGDGRRADRLGTCIASRTEEQGFSGAVSVIKDGQLAAFVARGVQAGPGSASISANTRFNIGSASKMFTAVAIAQLADEGKLSFDDPVGKYVADLAPETANVTLRYLLTHTAGLGNFFVPENRDVLDKARSAADLLPLIAAETPSVPPGSEFRYSNSGFALLGVVVERITGATYGDYLEQKVFRPAGMLHSGVNPEPLETLAIPMTSRSAGESAGETLRPASPRPRHGTPAGGVYSTAGDLGKFAAALWGDRLMAPATIATMTSAKVAPDRKRPERAYGYGFAIHTDADGAAWIGHNGGTIGVNAEFFMRPADGSAIIVLSNRDPPSATKMFEFVRGIVDSEERDLTCGPQP
jgi:CubicO group peptidase (beta-lactamase class C family)